jgi:hypothetical protein
LGCDADAAFVQDFDGDFVALAFGAEDVFLRDVEVVEVEETG